MISVSDMISRLRALIEEAEANGILNGTIGVYENGLPLIEMACGMSDFALGEKMSVDATFDLASITKQFTCSAICLLEARGLLSVTDKISKYIEGIPYDVTLEMLMNHTSGMPDEGWAVQFLEDCSHPITNDKLIEILRAQPAEPLFAPGEGWCYSNIAYELLAPVVEIVSGRNFEDFLREEFFLPAGMEHTRVHHRYMNLPAPHKATNSYCFEEGHLVEPDKSKGADFIVTLEGVNGAGLVYSSIGDMNKWDQALRKGNVLSPEIQQKMWKKVPTTRPGESYGYGWFFTEDGQWIHHSGGWPGYINQFYRRIDRPLTMVMLTNLQRDREALDAFVKNAVAILSE